MTFWRRSRFQTDFDLWSSIDESHVAARVTCGGNDLLVCALPISSPHPPTPATRSLFPASFCYEGRIIDWEHGEPSRRRRVRRGGAQGGKQIDKKGIKQGGKRMWAVRGMWASTGEDGEWKNALTCHSEVWVYRKGRWEQSGWWEDKFHLWEFKSFLGSSQ